MENDWRAEHAARKADIVATLESIKLTVESVFVPMSQSRNKDESLPTLNWNVTVKLNGRDILTTDYSAGMAHCPAYDRKVPDTYNRPLKTWREDACRAECEKGFPVVAFTTWGGFRHDMKSPIKPDSVDLMHSLVMDSDVLESGGFEEWAADLGYDTDSRKAESIYRACLEIALKMRGALGDAGLAKLREAFQDY